MPYHYILANLLASNADAVGVLFLDDTGETVDLACADYTPYQMRILGAYMGICLRQVGRLLRSMPWGEPQLVHVEKEGLHLYAMRLPDEYYLVLVQRRPALVGRARITLADAAAQLREALF
jgi:predicted regulator of Ras-like GTPase activity (Roadblock/LC7/MglB family)